ncbi:transposase [Amycolatopsis acidiphila]|uniref:transposase n=1 Tax=Amycolatopsis acidiphila TaxID=715473 RepID=UPI001643C2D6|nr:transposase [Amycolatopsis acidiphila]
MPRGTRSPRFSRIPWKSGRVLYTTNMIESLNVRLPKATRNRGAFPSERAALKTLYLTIRTMTRPDGAIGITRSNRLEGYPQRVRHPVRRPHQHQQVGHGLPQLI